MKVKGYKKRIRVSPSVLSADFGSLASQIKEVEVAGADMLHIDVMDGQFVPNITIGPVVVKDIRKVTRLPLDVHLMIANPELYIDRFVEAGSDMITMHIETISGARLKKEALKLKKLGIKVGVALNPATSLSKIKSVLSFVDLVLVMTVNPGFSGQKFIPAVLPKIKRLRSIFDGDIAVDGGINHKLAAVLINAGADILASGSYIFGAKDKKTAIERIRHASG